MNELLLNCNIGGLFLTMGLPTLDPVMTSVLDYIHQHALFLGSWGGDDDAWTARHRCDEAVPNCGNLAVYRLS